MIGRQADRPLSAQQADLRRTSSNGQDAPKAAARRCENNRRGPTLKRRFLVRQRLVGLTRKRSFVAARVPVIPTSGSRQFIEKRLRFFEIARLETFGEPAVDRREEIPGIGVAALVAAEP